MTTVSPLLIPFEKIEMMMMLKRRMSPPGHSESLAGPIGGHPHPYESHSTWSNHLAPHHSRSTEICQIFRPGPQISCWDNYRNSLDNHQVV